MIGRKNKHEKPEKITFVLGRDPLGGPKKRACHHTILDHRDKVGMDILERIVRERIPVFKGGGLKTKKCVVYLEMSEKVRGMSIRAQVEVRLSGPIPKGAGIMIVAIMEVCGIYEVEITPNSTHSVVTVKKLTQKTVYEGSCEFVKNPEVKVLS